MWVHRHIKRVRNEPEESSGACAFKSVCGIQGERGEGTARLHREAAEARLENLHTMECTRQIELQVRHRDYMYGESVAD